MSSRDNQGAGPSWRYSSTDRAPPSSQNVNEQRNQQRQGHSIYNRQGRVDRQRQQFLERQAQVFIQAVPRTDGERRIKETYDEVIIARNRGVKIPNLDSLNSYLTMRYERHNVWVDYIDRSRTAVAARQGDVRVDRFCYDLRLRGMDCLLPDVDIGNLTPDLLFYDEDRGYIFLGDVAVTASVIVTDRSKTYKYSKVKKFFTDQGYRVVNCNFVVLENMDNVSASINKLVNMSIITFDEADIETTKLFHKKAQETMEMLYEVVENPVALKSDISRTDRRDEPQEIEIPDLNIEVPVFEPTVPEDELIRQLVNETGIRMAGGFFNNDHNLVDIEFENIINGNRGKPFKPPKSTLMVCDNSTFIEELSNHDLINDYITDLDNNEEVNKYILGLLPSRTQLAEMKSIYAANRKETNPAKKVFGPYQYSIKRYGTDMTTKLINKLTRSKKLPNEKTEPVTIHPDEYDRCVNFIEGMMEYYGSESKKPSFLDDSWFASNQQEINDTARDREIYNMVKSTNGAQLAGSLSQLYNRISHLSSKHSRRDNIFIPPNGSFIAVLPKEHSPVNRSSCEIPMIFICRFPKGVIPKHVEFEYTTSGHLYDYYVSKLCRLGMSKLSNWDQAGYRVVASSSYLLTKCPELMACSSKVIGALTLFTLDAHQKTSEYLDLMKYLPYMPFSLSRLPALVKDKLDLHIKTSLNVWLFLQIRSFLHALATANLNARKNKIHLFNGEMTRECKGIKMTIPAFFDHTIMHPGLPEYIEECTVIYIVRPKHLYGSQFMDKSINDTVQWSYDYEDEVRRYGSWVVTGEPNDQNPEFPFDAKFAFSKDMIIYANNSHIEKVPISNREVMSKLSKEKYLDYCHKICSLRGCTKYERDRKNNNDLHNTSISEVLIQYERNNYQQDRCTIPAIAKDFYDSGTRMEFSMSEKDQRGGGRPIATPTLGTKALLAMVEKPEAAIGQYCSNNILVSGTNKSKIMADSYAKHVAETSQMGFTKIAQLTEDQSKFSENDNCRKFEVYIGTNSRLPISVRKYQIAGIRRLENREHLVHRLPQSVVDDPIKLRKINNKRNGVVTNIGWPQGMLNFISTSVHVIADKYITELYNKAYPYNKVHTTGLVHSDDSWVVVSYNHQSDMERFAIFRMLAKRMFCLKLNEKKVWSNPFLGEMVSSFNLNANVHLSVAKAFCNSFNNLLYQNWVIDTSSQVSSLQQVYRNGGTIGNLILMATILRQQIIGNYNVKGRHLEMIHTLPVELGGYPDTDVFTTAVTGIQGYYEGLYRYYMENQGCDEWKIVSRVMILSNRVNSGVVLTSNYRFAVDPNINNRYIRKEAIFNEEGKFIGFLSGNGEVVDDLGNIVEGDDNNDELDWNAGIVVNDYDTVNVTGRGDIFTSIKHLMPKSNKITRAIELVRSLPFTGTGMPMIITKPETLYESLGDLKDQSSSLLYNLASERYSQNSRRLAVSQALQATGKVVKIGELMPMTINQMLEFVLLSDYIPSSSIEVLKNAFITESDIPKICKSIIADSELVPCEPDKRIVINRLPMDDNKYSVISGLRNVLLYIVDGVNPPDEGTYLGKYGNMRDVTTEMLESDSRLIKARFCRLFNSMNVKYSCNLIMQQSTEFTYKKYWMQPHLRNDTIELFMSDLYGKTLNSTCNYKVITKVKNVGKVSDDSKLVDSMYTCMTLNTKYGGKFEPMIVDGKQPFDALKIVDYSKLDINGMAKYCLMMFDYTRDVSFISSYIRSKDFEYYWEVPQRFNPEKGIYEGYFVVVIRYQYNVLKFSGEIGRISIMSSTNNIDLILECMHRFTMMHFTFYRYAHRSLWQTSELWKSGNQQAANLYLASVGGDMTKIQQTPGRFGIPFTLAKNLNYKRTIYVNNRSNYMIDENYRCIVEVKGEKVSRVLSVNQDFNNPAPHRIKLRPDLVDGLSNIDLYHTNAIVDLILRRYHNTSRHVYMNILRGRIPGIDLSCITKFHKNLVKSRSGRQIEMVEFDCVEEEVIQIQAITMGETIEGMMETAPDDLGCIDEMKLDISHAEGSRMYPIVEVTKLICKIVSGFCSMNLIKDFVYENYREKTMRQIFLLDTGLSDEELDEKYDIDNETLSHYSSSDLAIFIMGNDMNNRLLIDSLNLGTLLNTRNRQTNILSIVNYCSVYTRIILDCNDKEEDEFIIL